MEGLRPRWTGAMMTRPWWMSQLLGSLKGLPNIVVDGKEGDEQGKGVVSKDTWLEEYVEQWVWPKGLDPVEVMVMGWCWKLRHSTLTLNLSLPHQIVI